MLARRPAAGGSDPVDGRTGVVTGRLIDLSTAELASGRPGDGRRSHSVSAPPICAHATRLAIGSSSVAVPASKDELIGAIERTFADLNRDVDRVPTECARRPVLEGHSADTLISPADLLAYLIGWSQQVLTWHDRREAGLPDEFPAAGFKWNELGLLAQHYYSEWKDDDWSTLRARLVDTNGQILALVHGRSDHELYGDRWYGKWTMGRMVSLNTSSPNVNARRRLRAWLRTL